MLLILTLSDAWRKVWETRFGVLTSNVELMLVQEKFMLPVVRSAPSIL